MNYVELADCAGVTLHDLRMLLQGKATSAVADQLGVTMADVEAFINGADQCPDDTSAWPRNHGGHG